MFIPLRLKFIPFRFQSLYRVGHIYYDLGASLFSWAQETVVGPKHNKFIIIACVGRLNFTIVVFGNLQPTVIR